MKEFFNKIFISAIILVALQIAFMSLRSIVNIVPYRWISNNIYSSKETLKNEGIYYGPTELNRVGIKYDNWTAADDYMLMIAGTEDKFSLFSFIPNNLALIEPAETPIEEFSNYLEKGKGERYEYGRYWSGSLVFLMPLTIFFDLAGIRIIYLFASIILIIAITLKMIQKGDKIMALSFPLFFIFSGLLFNQMCPVFSQEGFVILFSLFFIYYFLDDEKIKKYEPYFFIVVGAITNYLCWLSYPLLTLEIVLLIYLSIRLKNETKLKTWISHITIDSLAWCIGFATTMMTKGLLCKIYGVSDTTTTKAGLLLGDYSIIERLKIAFHRIIGEGGYYNCFIIMGLLIILATIYLYARKNNLIKVSYNIPKIISFLIISLFPIVWCFIVALHAYVHGSEIMLFSGTSLAIILIFKSIIIDEDKTN